MPLTIDRAKIDRDHVDDRHIRATKRDQTMTESPFYELPEAFRDEITEMEFLSNSGFLRIEVTDDVTEEQEEIFVPKSAIEWMERDVEDRRVRR